MKKTAPNADPQWKKTAALPAEKVGERNRRIGNIGSRARSSQGRKGKASNTPSANRNETSPPPQPAALPRTSAQTIPRAAPETSARPGTSIGVSAPKLSSIRVSESG